MSVVTITISGKQFQLACNDGEEGRLKAAASTLSSNIDHLKGASPKANSELLLIMCALGMQDEIESLKDKLIRMGDTGEDEKVAETLSTIAGYLESLAKKVAR
jgi:cell division protein ZapA (FtsZ GTPase activity inhibitor)